MIVLHGIYENGKVTITDKAIPDIKAEVEIIIAKILTTKCNKSKMKGKTLASDTVVKMRNEI